MKDIQVLWTMKSQDKIAPEDMEDGHINNTINMLKRKYGLVNIFKAMLIGLHVLTNPDIEIVKKEKKPLFNGLNGEMAQASIDDAMMDEECPWDEYDIDPLNNVY